MSRARDLANLGDGITTTDLPDITADKLDVGQIGGRRNLIINGAMQVWQRSTSATIGADSYVAADRWKGRDYGGPGDYVMALDTSDVPSGQSFTNAMKCTVGTTDTPGTYAYGIQHNLEGYAVSPLRVGTSDAQQATLSFWAKSSVAGTYCVSARGSGGAASYVFEYTLAANTWTKITHTIAAPTTTTPTWNTTNGSCFILEWNLGAQTSKITSTTEAWHDGNYLTTSNQTAWISNSGATFYITGVQLEVGSVATPFEHRSYGEELALCQRYTYVIYNPEDTLSAYGGTFATTSRLNALVDFPVPMRAPPATFSVNAASNWGIVTPGYLNAACSTVTLSGATRYNAVVLATSSTNSFRVADPGNLYTTSVNANMIFEAEL